jgi:2-amino-4-hydroxy-6-hydroxymethyldihydropteridine diphosphokinase
VHHAYLSLGSNIEPEINLPKAIDLLQKYGEVLIVSNAWESEAVGSAGPNFLNAFVLFSSPLSQNALKEQVIDLIEGKLGRKRSADKSAPRTIDIDIVLFDGQLCNEKFWNQAFVIIPLAEIYPEYQNPITQESVLETATRFHQSVWIEPRLEVLSRFSGSNSKS